MEKNKKVLSVLSTAAVAGLIVAAVSTPASAKATAIDINDKAGKQFEYQYQDLKDSASASITGVGDATLYNDFFSRKASLAGYYDNVTKGHVSFATLSDALISGLVKDADTFKAFMEDAKTPTTAMTPSQVTVGTDGYIAIDGVSTKPVTQLGISSASAINGTITAVFNGTPATTPTAADFAVTCSINGGTATTVAPTVVYNATAKTATLTVPTIAQTSAAQSVVYSISYKGQAAVTATVAIAATTTNVTVAAAGSAGDNVVKVYFSAPVDVTTGTTLENYKVNTNTGTNPALVTPTTVTLNSDAVGPYAAGQIATLTFPATTLTANPASVKVSNVKAISGSVIATATLPFTATAAADNAAPTFAATPTLTDGVAAPGAISVVKGTKVTLNAVPADASNNIVAIQYRIETPLGAIGDWVTMNISNPPFDNVTETGIATIDTSNLVPGVNVIRVRAIDANNNISTTAAANNSVNLTVLAGSGDVTAPRLDTAGGGVTPTGNFSLVDVTGANAQGAKTVRVTGTALDTTGGAIATASVQKVEYRLRSYDTVAGTYAVVQDWTATNPTDGAFGGATEAYNVVTPALTLGKSYIIEVRATDAAGNTSAPIACAAPANTAATATTPGLSAPLAGTFTVTNDTTVPVAGTVVANAAAGFTALGTNLLPSNNANVSLTTTGGANATDNNIVADVQFAVYKVNGDGSRSLVRDYSNVGVTATDADGKFDSASESYAINYTLPSVSGTYQFDVVSIDAAGNRSAIATTTHVLDVTAPTATITANTATTNNPYDFVVTFSEPVVIGGGAHAADTAANYQVVNAAGAVVGTLTTAPTATGTANQFIINFNGSAAEEAAINAGNTIRINGVQDAATNNATGTYTITAADMN